MIKTLAEIAHNLDTDKTQSQGYITNFERHFNHLRNEPIKILELGVFHGGSLLMWQEYFAKGLVVGLDRKPNPLKEMPERVRFYRGSQEDDLLLDSIADECAPEGFDIIIDDASHIGTLSRASFHNLFSRHLKSGGIYVVEDWGTGYWDSWPDGMTYQIDHGQHPPLVEKFSLFKRLVKRMSWSRRALAPRHEIDRNFGAHNFGMVGFVKELVDEVGWLDITYPGRGNDNLPHRTSMIREMTIYPGHVFLVKA
jgi:SAM-dependent methyltransferase